jgi:hypothetical protein
MNDKMDKIRKEIEFLDSLYQLQDFFLNFNYIDGRELTILLTNVLKEAKTFRTEVCDSLHEEIKFRKTVIEDKLL